MREYRGKRVKDGKWIYGWYSESFTKSSSYEKTGPFIKWFEDGAFWEAEVLPESVGQYTGFEFDDDKTECYDGDLCRRNKGKSILEVMGWKAQQDEAAK